MIHRCYGAVEVDGNVYRVKVTLKEYHDKNESTKAYSYETTKIELFAGTLANDGNSTTDPGTNSSLSAANLLKDVEMSYNPGVKVLEESEKRTEKPREHRVYHGSGAEFDAFDHFNEADAQIIGHARFFRTANGEAYGYTVGGKIYLDPKIATAETPIHEYSHLWADALRKVNPEEWKNVVGLMKGTSVWSEVEALYPDLTTDEEIADEVLAHYSGRRGAERLRRAVDEAVTGKKGVLEMADAVAAIARVKDALTKFWKTVADWLGIHFTTAEDVADKVMADLLAGVNPMAADGKGRSLAGIHNISEEKLEKALKMGGLANPSVAMKHVHCIGLPAK